MSDEDEGRPLGNDMQPIDDRGGGNTFYYVAIAVVLAIGIAIAWNVFRIPDTPETPPATTETMAP